MATKSKASIPDDLLQKLNAADKARGFPIGTMASVMQQESGGQARFLDKPDTYHYELNAEGKRIAGHTGKVSTAFGPFGILESTGRDPGYGVKPLASKDIDEQIRFAADYLGARSAKAGGLQAGLAGYGEGEKYANQVMARAGGGAGRGSVNPPAVVPQETQIAAVPAPQVVAQELPALQASGAVQVAQAEPAATGPTGPSWDEHQALLAQAIEAQGQKVAPVPNQFAAMQNYGLNVPNFQGIVPQMPTAIDFRSFGKWGGRATA